MTGFSLRLMQLNQISILGSADFYSDSLYQSNISTRRSLLDGLPFQSQVSRSDSEVECQLLSCCGSKLRGFGEHSFVHSIRLWLIRHLRILQRYFGHRPDQLMSA